MRKMILTLALACISVITSLAGTAPVRDSVALEKRAKVHPLAIVSFDVKVRTSDSTVKARAFIRFFDNAGKEILTYRGDDVSDTAWQNTGYYTEAPALASTLALGIEKSAGKGRVSAEDLKVNIEDASTATHHAPQVNLDEYMRPFWKTDTIFNETVLMYAQSGGQATGRLLYQPTRVLSVRSFDLATTYQEGKDYTFDGRNINRPGGSQMPFRADTSFDTKKDFAWFNIQSQWVVVTYIRHDAWKGPVPSYKAKLLPKTVALLRAKAPMRIVAYGMSITRGLNVSSYDSVAPYMPTYVDLFTRSLQKAYHDPKVVLYNAGLPGSVVDWGAHRAEKYVTPLKPNLVILDFGMNDFWRMTPEEFSHYIDTIMVKCRRANPKVEFILLSNMKFDPDYLKNSDGKASWYKANLLGYAYVLSQKEGPGVANLDMTTLSGYIYSQKKAKDCIANPLHPNDYLARWYAQGLKAMLVH